MTSATSTMPSAASAFRARLIASNGNATTRQHGLLQRGYRCRRLDLIEVMAIRLVDQWVENVVNDTGHGSAAAKVSGTSPGLVDACFTSPASGSPTCHLREMYRYTATRASRR